MRLNRSLAEGNSIISAATALMNPFRFRKAPPEPAERAVRKFGALSEIGSPKDAEGSLDDHDPGLSAPRRGADAVRGPFGRKRVPFAIEEDVFDLVDTPSVPDVHPTPSLAAPGRGIRLLRLSSKFEPADTGTVEKAAQPADSYEAPESDEADAGPLDAQELEQAQVQSAHASATQAVEIAVGNFVAEADTIGARHFGGIYSTFFGLNSFATQYEALSMGHVRWPGGTRGETARDTNDVDGDGDTAEYLFDLRAEGVLLVPGKGLSDVFAQAALTGATVSIFLPSLRYFGQTGQAAEDVAYFIARLLDGAFGALPGALTIEIGNESLDGSVETAALYGAVANAQLAAIRMVAEMRGLDLSALGIDLAVQIGRSAEEDQAIRDQLDADALGMIDALVAHHLPINLRNHNTTLDATSPIDAGDSRFTRSGDYIDAWEAAIAEATGDPAPSLDFYVSAWTVGGSSDPDPGELAYHDFGARQARTTVDTFARIIAEGADGASLWGIDARSNPNWYSRLDGGEPVLSHGGEAFRLMAESLEGTRLLEGYAQPVPSIWDGLYNEFWVYAYEGEDSVVLFVAANDIDGPLAVSLALAGVDPGTAVEVTRLGTRLDPETPTGITDDELRLWELPELTESLLWSSGDTIELELLQDYEVVRLIAHKDPAALSGTVPPWHPFFLLSEVESGTQNDTAWALSAAEFSGELLV